MSEDDAKRSRIKAKVAASQARQKRDAPPSAPRPRRVSKTASSTDDRALWRRYPWLVVGGGIAAGLAVAALLPRGVGRRFGKRALAAAAVGSEVALTFGRQAREAAFDASREAGERLEDFGETVSDGTAELRGRAARAGGAAARQARETGLGIAREAIRLAARVRR